METVGLVGLASHQTSFRSSMRSYHKRLIYVLYIRKNNLFLLYIIYLKRIIYMHIYVYYIEGEGRFII